MNAIHWLHRLGALITALYLAWLAWRLRAVPALSHYVKLIATLLTVQLALGIAIVLLHLPVVLAAAHHAGAALLLLTMVALNYRYADSARSSI